MVELHRLEPWDIAGRAVSTTRDDAMPAPIKTRREAKRAQARKNWQEKEAERLLVGRRPRSEPVFPLPRLTSEEKAMVRKRVRRYTTMDYLYRLRIKSNYEDSTMFTDGPTDENASRYVHRDLMHLASSVLLMHELHIRGLVGIPAMRQMIDNWLGRSAPSDRRDVGLALRRDLILAP